MWERAAVQNTNSTFESEPEAPISTSLFFLVKHNRHVRQPMGLLMTEANGSATWSATLTPPMWTT